MYTERLNGMERTSRLGMKIRRPVCLQNLWLPPNYKCLQPLYSLSLSLAKTQLFYEVTSKSATF